MTSQDQQPRYATEPSNLVDDLFGDVVTAAASPSGLPPVTPQQARNAVDVPQPFATIACQLPDPVLAKLKTLDTSTAMVSLKSKTTKAGPEPLGYLMAGDFAENCAEELRCGGKIRVMITHKVGNKSENLYFSMRIDGASVPEQTDGDKMLALFKQMQEVSDKKFEKLERTLLLQGGGGNQPDQFAMLEKAVSLVDKMRGPQVASAQPTDLNAQMTGMVSVFKGVAEVQNELRTAASAIAPAAEKSTTDQLNEFAESPLGNDVRDAVKYVIKKKIGGGGGGGGGDSSRLAKGPTEPPEDIWNEAG